VGDACDSCPNDPNKTVPGVCGCGTLDTDADADGIADCKDTCLGTPEGEPVNADGCSDSQLNKPPIANAGADRNVEMGTVVTLDGSESYDPEREMISLLWSFAEVPAGSGVTEASLSDVTSAKPTFTPDIRGTYRLKLIANDGVLDSAPDELLIVAANQNVTPNADAGLHQDAKTGNQVQLDGSKSYDPDKGPGALSYLWSFNTVPQGSSLTDNAITDREQPKATFVPDAEGTYVLRLTVNDGDLISEDTTEIIAASSNVPPNADAGDDVTIAANQTAILDGSRSNDPDNSPETLTYNWRFVVVPVGSGRTSNDISGADTVSPSFIPDIKGTYVLGLKVSDGQNSDFDNVAVTVADIPIISVLPGKVDFESVGVNSFKALQMPALTNIGTAELKISAIEITGNDAAMFSVEAGMCLSLLPTIAPDGNCTITVVFLPTSTGLKNANLIIRSNDQKSSEVIVPLSGTGINTPPTAEAGGPYAGSEGYLIMFDASGSSDPNSDTLQYRWDFENDGTWDTEWSSSPTSSHTWNNEWSGTARVGVSDGEFTAADTADVIVNNVAPVTDDKSVSTNEDIPVGIALTASDSGNDTLTFSIESYPSNGLLSGTPPDLTYTPNPNWNGTNTFTYKANDGVTDSNIATVTITVNPINDPPVCSADTATTNEDNSVTIAVTSNDNAGPPDEDQTLTITSVTQGGNGTVVNNGNNTITYMSNPNYNGSDSFSYTISDSGGLTDTATVNVIVNPVNDPPVCADDNAVTDEDTSVVINVTSNDNAGPPNEVQTLTVVSITQGTNGTVINNSDAS
jgi:hypothetical protein